MSKDPTRFLSKASKDALNAGGGLAAEWNKVLTLCGQPGVINLGQGAPNFAGSSVAREAAIQALDKDVMLNQYSPVSGHPDLLASIASFCDRTYSQKLRPSEILVCTSGTECLDVACKALFSPGDKVLILNPSFPWYVPCVKHTGADAVIVDLQAPDFRLPMERIEEELGKGGIKGLILNTPHNPTGKILEEEEARQLAELVIRYDLVVISDEAYEAQVFRPFRHVRLSTVPGMFDHTLTLSTASKMFSLTGWRVGWLTGPETLINAARSVHSFQTYCAPTPFQFAIAKALDEDRSHGPETAELMRSNAELLASALAEAGLKPLPAKGGYFVTADVSSTGLNDFEFAEVLVREAKVGVAPMRVFSTGSPSPALNLVRIAVCKSRETIEEAANRIRVWGARRTGPRPAGSTI